jgi:Ca2+-binding RTX toxin-like protein
LLDNNAATTSISIDGGAGNDTITTTDVQNDTLLGGNGDDTITGATGNDSIDGGAGNDVVRVASGDITANDTISGGTGTADVLAYTTFVAVTDNAVAAQQQVSNFEVLSMAGAAAVAEAVTLTNYINNTGFTNINLGIQGAAANGYSFANASSILNTISVSAAAASVLIGTHVFDRLVDTATDALTIGNATTGTGAAQLITAFTALDEETITLTEVAGTTAGANDLTISTLTVADLTTLNISSASDVIITAAIAGAANLATVNASTSTGAVTVDASLAGTAVTMTANSSSTAVNTFTGGAFADVITGSAGNDVLVGGAGKDTISGGAGTDNITGGIGADNMTGGTGVDTFNGTLTSSVASSATAIAGATLAAGDTLTFGNGVDVITDFTAGAGGDVLENTAAAVAAIATGIGQNVTTGFATATTNYFVSGTYNATTGSFTVSADGVGADSMIVFGDATPTALAASTHNIILVGVDTDNLVAANFT